MLTIEEIVKLLGELPEPWKTGVYVRAATGLRVNELLGLKSFDIDFAVGEIHLCVESCVSTCSRDRCRRIEYTPRAFPATALYDFVIGVIQRILDLREKERQCAES